MAVEKSPLDRKVDKYLEVLGREARGIMNRNSTKDLELEIPSTRALLPFYIMEQVMLWEGENSDDPHLVKRASQVLNSRANTVLTNQHVLNLAQGLRPITNVDCDYLKVSAWMMVYDEAKASLVRSGQSLAQDLARPSIGRRVSDFISKKLLVQSREDTPIARIVGRFITHFTPNLNRFII